MPVRILVIPLMGCKHIGHKVADAYMNSMLSGGNIGKLKTVWAPQPSRFRIPIQRNLGHIVHLSQINLQHICILFQCECLFVFYTA